MITVNLEPRAVNDAVAEAIRTSVLGEAITKMVTDYVKQLGSPTSYNNPVKALVEETVKKLIIEEIAAIAPQLQEEIRKQLSIDMQQRIVTVAIEKFSKAVY